jgi:hypothetical protein
MAATFSLPQASYPAATRQGIIDTIPGSAVGAQITVTNVGWPAATSVNITVEQSFDNGASWQPWCGSSLAETMGETDQRTFFGHEQSNGYHADKWRLDLDVLRPGNQCGADSNGGYSGHDQPNCCRK